MKGFRYLEKVTTLEYAPEACAGCGACAQVCPHQVFRLEGERATIVDADLCMECGACMVNCPTGAIRVDAGVGCAAGMIGEWLKDISPGLFKSSKCC